MTAFPKADVQNVHIGVDLNVRFWPKADIETESKWVFLNVRFGEKSGHSALNASGVIGITGVGSN